MFRQVENPDPRAKRPLAMALVATFASCGGSDATIADRAAAPNGSPSFSASVAAVRTCGPGIAAVTLDHPVLDTRSASPTLTVQVSIRGLDAFPTAPATSAVQPLRVSVFRGETEVAVLVNEPAALPATTFRGTWNGRVADVPAAPGAYTVRVRYGCAAEALATRVNVVRTGVLRVTAGDGDGARIPLLWHALGDIPDNYWLPPNDRPILVRGDGASAAALDADASSAAPIPALDPGISSPAVTAAGDPADTNYNLPFAIRTGTSPDLALAFGLDDGGATPPVIRARVEGAHADDATITANGTVTYRFDATPAASVGRYDLAVQVHYEVRRDDATWAEFAVETLPLRVYGLLGDQTISAEHDAPYAPWVAVVDAVTQWVGGTTNDPHAVAGIIVHHVNEMLDLHYDTRMGASFYTQYGNDGFANATFDLTGFLDRADGSTVNCSDCASIVATYANMVGCDLGYSILTRNFRLHYIRAIGTPAFTNDPFHRGMAGGFNYHAITNVHGTATDIFDATLVEDGDDNPDAAPFQDDTPDGLARPFYLSHLSPARLTTYYGGKTAIQ